MTTLSKEDVVRMAGISGISIGNSESSPYPTNFQLHAFATLVRADLVAENERLTDSNQMYLDRIEYLERKYRCHNEYAKRPILYTDGVDGEQCCRDDLWAVSTAELSAMTDQLTAARTALAAAEAREANLRDALDNHSGNYKLSKDECAKVNALLDAPRDDSALREMIAGVYEECAKVCEDDAKGWTDYSCEMAARDCADAIRALAEKAKGE